MKSIIVDQYHAGASVNELSQKYGVSSTAIYVWKKAYTQDNGASMASYDRLEKILVTNPNVPIKKLCAFQAHYMNQSLLFLFGSMRRKYLTIVNTIQLQARSNVLSTILSLSYNDVLRMDNMNESFIHYFIHHLADIAIFPPSQVDRSQYLTIKDLMSAFESNEKYIVDQLEKGRFKGAFILDGEWLKPRY